MDIELAQALEENAKLKKQIHDLQNDYEMIDNCNRIHENELKAKDKQIAELEKQISILLSCKDCPENKGGYICEKEYNDKCLAQKIQYIKELQEKLEIEQNARGDWFGKAVTKDRQLTKAKEHIENLLYYVKQCSCERSNYAEIEQDIKEAEQFLKRSE